MRRNIEQIEIKEPPIRELTKKRSCIKRSCTTGCGCIIIFLIASLILLRFTSGPSTKELKKVPDNFPTTIPIYDNDNINKISFISGKEKNPALEIIAFVPKLVLSPILIALDKNISKENPSSTHFEETNNNTGWKSWLKIIKEPVADHRDTVRIEWSELSAEPRFVEKYYKTELEKHEYSIDYKIVSDDNTKEFSFSLDNIDGILFIKDNPEKSGTDYVSLIVNFPTGSTSS